MKRINSSMMMTMMLKKLIRVRPLTKRRRVVDFRATPPVSIGDSKVSSIPLETKEAAVDATHSLQLAQLRQLTRLSTAPCPNFLNNNLSIAQTAMVTQAAVVV